MTDETRKLGLNCLKTVIKKESNLEIIEQELHDATLRKEKDGEYYDIYCHTLFQIILDLKNKIPLSQIQKRLQNDEDVWMHPVYEKIRFDEIEQDNFIIQPFEIEEGVLECRCGSKRVFSYQKQSRSSDEPMSTYAKCMACKARWVYSG